MVLKFDRDEQSLFDLLFAGRSKFGNSLSLLLLIASPIENRDLTRLAVNARVLDRRDER
jgi:hypothetical protein